MPSSDSSVDSPFRDAILTTQTIPDMADSPRWEPICANPGLWDRLDSMPPVDLRMSLAYYVWPRRQTEEIWRRQLDLVREALPRFDGVKAICLAHDADTLPVDTTGFDEVYEVDNSPTEREVPGWRLLMERMQREPGATTWLHAKGVGRGWESGPHLRAWCELASETMLNVDRVRKSLAGHLVTGCFRRTEPAGNLGVPWHYSGSFYAVMNDTIRFPESIAGGWYAEAWPGLIASYNSAACLRFDGCGDLYQAENWREVTG